MKVLGIRYCHVSSEGSALARFLGPEGFGLTPVPLPPEAQGFEGGVFTATDGSWVEVWAEGPEMPAGTMLQVVVDDADAWAEQARAKGLEPQGPMEAHGEKIYFLNGPAGFHMSFQSALPKAG